MSAPVARSITLAALLLAAPVVAAQAQIGGAFKKAKEAAAGKAGDAAAAQVPPKTVDALPCAASYEQLDALQRGLQAELDGAAAAQKEAEQKQKQAEAEQKAYEKASKDYDKQYAAYDACREKVRNDPTANARAEQASAKAEREMKQATGNIDQAALEAGAQKAKEAAERISKGTGTAADRQTLADYQAMMAKISSGTNAAIAAQGEMTQLSKEQEEKMAKCGQEPTRPTAPSNLGWSPERVLMEKGAKAANMDPEAYKLVRECAVQSANLRLNNKNRSDADAKKMNDKLDQIQKTITQMRAAKVPI